MIIALAGGVGGARLAVGLATVLPPGALTVVVNTADDFEHLGVHISPDLDTVMYTLAGLGDWQRGWGLAGETWDFMEALERLGGETWFRLGDRDLATHVERTRRLRAGEPLSAVTADFSRRLGIGHAIVPMSDRPVRTVVETDAGTLSFQHYFVREAAGPTIKRIAFEGIDNAVPSAGFRAALGDPTLRAVVVCPSNPFISIAPILDLPGLRKTLHEAAVPVVAVSPIIGGHAVKGPAARMMRDLGHDASAVGVAALYRDLLAGGGFVLDQADADLAPEVEALGMSALVVPTRMAGPADSARLAESILAFSETLSRP